MRSKSTQDFILGYSQQSLPGLIPFTFAKQKLSCLMRAEARQATPFRIQRAKKFDHL